MSDAIITVENLSKKYLVGHKTGDRNGYRYVALRDVIGREIRNATRKTIDIVWEPGTPDKAGQPRLIHLHCQPTRQPTGLA